MPVIFLSGPNAIGKTWAAKRYAELTCDWQVMEAHMRRRCASRNKRFRDDVYTERVLKYESSKRYHNFVAQYLKDPKQYQFLTVNDQERDWPVVDEAFAKVYRMLHNALRQQGGSLDHPTKGNLWLRQEHADARRDDRAGRLGPCV